MSVQATHTPGPWSVRPRESRYTTLGNGAQIWSGQVHVASVTMKADKPFFQKRADAYLIAAAPQMADALRPFLAAMADIGESEDDADHYRNAHRDYAQAPAITVGDIRRAAAALRQALGQYGESAS